MSISPYGLSQVSEETFAKIKEVQSQPPSKTILMANYLEFKEKYDQWFEKHGYMTAWTEDGLDILYRMSEQKVDAVVLNLMLNTVDGLEVIKALRKKIGLKIPIIVLTMLTSERAIKESFIEGANHYLIMSEYTPEEAVEEIVGVTQERG